MSMQNSAMRELTVEEIDAVSGGEMTAPKIDWRPTQDQETLSAFFSRLFSGGWERATSRGFPVPADKPSWRRPG